MSVEVLVTGHKFHDVSKLPQDHLQGNQQGGAWLSEQSWGQEVIKEQDDSGRRTQEDSMRSDEKAGERSVNMGPFLGIHLVPSIFPEYLQWGLPCLAIL